MDLDIKKIQENFILSNESISFGYNSISGLLNIYSFKQEKSIVEAQNKVALSQYLPTNNTLLLKDKREKLKYVTPDTWTDAFKLIKLLWQTRQLA
jgi:hypothetical protein